MIDRRRALAASFEEARRLAGQRISEVTPSRRDFALYVTTHKQDLAVIARLPPAGLRWDHAQLVAHARECDGAEVAALAVATGADSLSMRELAALAEATTVPILHDNFTVVADQLHYARLHGADAALFPAELGGDTLQELAATASSLHMASVVDVASEMDVAAAVHLPRVIVALRCTDNTGRLDVERTRRLAQQLPRQYTVIALPEVSSPAECAALRGVCDAVMAGEMLMQSSDVGAAIRSIMGAGC
jgi:indole-3-glycerol phosphate synthase